MNDDCEDYKAKLKVANLEISKLQAYNSACEDTLLDIELRFDQEIRRFKTEIKEWEELDPKADTTCMKFYVLFLERFRKELFKNEMSSEE